MEIIFNRRSVRKYTDKKIEAEVVERLMRAAMQAPSATNQQPWEFIVIDEKETFVCDGKYEVHSANGEYIRITCLDHHGAITAREALQYSCNDALSQMSEKINTEYFLAKLKQLGFGSKTGIEFTDDGKMVLEHSRKILEHYDTILKKLDKNIRKIIYMVN